MRGVHGHKDFRGLRILPTMGAYFWNLSCFLHPEHPCLLYRNNLHFSPSSLTNLYSYFIQITVCLYVCVDASHFFWRTNCSYDITSFKFWGTVWFISICPSYKLESKGYLFLIIIVSSTSNTVIPGNKISIERMKKWMNDKNTLPLILTIPCIGWNNQETWLGICREFYF